MMKLASALAVVAIAMSDLAMPAAAQPLTHPTPTAAHTPSHVTLVSQNPKEVKPQFRRRVVRLATNEAPGTIIVDTNNKYLYFIESNNRATRYGIGVGRDGFGWSGIVNVGRKAEWPTWT